MKKITAFILALFFFCFATTALAEKTTQTPAPNDDEAPIFIGEDMKVTSKFIDETLANSNSTIHAVYPQIIGKTLSPSAQNFNKVMQEKVTNEITLFKRYVAENLNHQQSLPKDLQKNYLSLDYDVDVIHPNHQTLVMVRIDIEGFQAGHAHPYHAHRVLNFDMQKGKELALGDLFKPNSRYLEKISDYCRKALAKNDLPQDWIKKGTQPDAKNFQAWNVQNDTLLITFDEYQVGPYVNGPQEVEIPYSELEDMMVTSSNVYACAQNPTSCEVG